MDPNRMPLPDRPRRIVRDAPDPAADLAEAEDDLVRAYLSARGVVALRTCRDGRGRSALFEMIGLVDRVAAGT